MHASAILFSRAVRRYVLLAALVAASAGCHQRGATPTRPEWQQLRLGLCEDYPEESRSLAAARRDLELTRDAGAKVLRIAFGWDAMEPRRGEYDWTFWDDFVRLAVDAYGIELIPYVCYTPRWAATDDGPDHWRSPPRDNADFARFVSVLVKRYGGWIRTWELWNEPDNAAYWTGTPAAFAELTRAGSQAVRAADPSARVVLGGLAGNLDFLDTLFREERIAPAVDIVNFHSYLETWHPDPIETLTSEIERAREIVRHFGENEPLWMAEVGYSSVGPRARTSDVYFPHYGDEHTREAQANALRRFIVLAAATGELTTFAWYRINDLPTDEAVIGDDNNRHLGLRDVAGRDKPAAAAFRTLAELFAGAYRVLPSHVEDSDATSPVETHAFEFQSGRRVLFAWLGMPRSRATAETPPQPDTRRKTVNIKIDAVGESIALTLELNGSRVSALLLDELRTPLHNSVARTSVPVH